MSFALQLFDLVGIFHGATPEDRLVWDVGHQTYAHKILTGRRASMARRATMAAAGRQLEADGRGALTRTLALLAPVLERVRPVG